MARGREVSEATAPPPAPRPGGSRAPPGRPSRPRAPGPAPLGPALTPPLPCSKCAECLKFDTGPFAKNCSAECGTTKLLPSRMSGRKCNERDSEGCWMTYFLVQRDGRDNYDLHVEETRGELGPAGRAQHRVLRRAQHRVFAAFPPLLGAPTALGAATACRGAARDRPCPHRFR